VLYRYEIALDQVLVLTGPDVPAAPTCPRSARSSLRGNDIVSGDTGAGGAAVTSSFVPCAHSTMAVCDVCPITGGDYQNDILSVWMF